MDSVAREALSVLQPTLPSNIRLQERIGQRGCEVVGVRHQLRQIIVNLANNAIQALKPDGGVLKVEVEEVQVDEEEAAELKLAGGGDMVRVSVRDTGRGMPPSVLERVFDPFFTTKELDEGTGLGLFLVRETVAGHGGGIRVESVEGWGTLFQIFLPSSHRTEPPASDALRPGT
jgi:signal transduction histidine kinase